MHWACDSCLGCFEISVKEKILLTKDMNDIKSETKSTIKYYDDNAGSFNTDTAFVDMHELQDWFLSNVKEKGHILDLGCGSGRDSKYFLKRGYCVTAVDGSFEMCEIAKRNTGLNVRQLMFSELDYKETFDAVWACASLLHVSYDELPEILKRIASSLKTDGIFYASFKKGDFRGLRNGRYFTDLTRENIEKLLEQTKAFTLMEYRESFDVRPGRNNEIWINVISKKI